MFTQIGLGNFKAFSDTQSIPLRPLTLIYGANSSGKSSIIHSLLYAHHAIETNELDAHLVKLGGNSVDLGGFKQFVHKRDITKRVHLEWEISSEGFSNRLKELLPNVERVKIGVTIGLNDIDFLTMDGLEDITPRDLAEAILEHAKKTGASELVEKIESNRDDIENRITLPAFIRLFSKLIVNEYRVELDSKLFLRLSERSNDSLRLDLFERDHPAAVFLIENLILAYSTSDDINIEEIPELSNIIDDLIPLLSFEVENLLPTKLIESEKLKDIPKETFLIGIKKESRPSDIKRVIESSLPGIIVEILRSLSDSIKKEFSKLTYLGPLRIYPPRHTDFSEINDPNWGAGGGMAWGTILKKPILQEKLNSWLGDQDKLSSSYELRVRNLITVESMKDKISQLISKASENLYNVEEDFSNDPYEVIDTASIEIPEKLERIESFYTEHNEVVLYDKRSQTTVSHRDVGIGISQVLPVLATCFSSKEKVIAMEQPEIHLHPALQSELGDVFIESALGKNKNTLIIETHSEHLILRILRRIRETADNELPSDKITIKPEDVSVLYVQPTNKGSEIIHIPVNDEGEFEKPWPHGFFAERAEELF